MSTIKLNEEQLKNLIRETIEETVDEGFWNNLKQGASTFANNMRNSDTQASFGSRVQNSFQNAKKNYQLQGRYDELSGLIQTLQKYVADRTIDGNLTINQLIGSNGRFGRMSGQQANLRGQMRRNGASEE